MIRAIVLFLLATVVGLGLLLLLAHVAIDKVRDARERRAMRVRDDQLRKYCITPELPLRRVK